MELHYRYPGFTYGGMPARLLHPGRRTVHFGGDQRGRAGYSAGGFRRSPAGALAG